MSVDNDAKNKENDIDFDVEVLNYVRRNRFVRRETLITHLIETHKKDSGYSRPNIERKITRLTKNGEESIKNPDLKRNCLFIVKNPELEQYGIYDKDTNASYLTVKEIIDIKVYLDTLFSYFISNDEYDKNSILDEIDLYRDQYSLTKEQLDVLVDNLSTDDEKLLFHILRILKEYILRRGIIPTKEEELIKSINSVLAKFSGDSKELEVSRAGLINVLGYFNSDSVIDWLKYDLKNRNVRDDFDQIKKDYGNHYTARIIDKHKLELFNLINGLKKEGKEEEAKLVYNIKHEAAIILGQITEDDSW